jgi:hypothetical protein
MSNDDPISRAAYLLVESDRTVSHDCRVLDQASKHIRSVKCHMAEITKQSEVLRSSMKARKQKALERNGENRATCDSR